KLHDVNQVDEEPHQPRQQTGNVDAKNICDGGSAADYRHLAFIEIMKWRRFALPFHARADHFCDVRSALHRDLRDAGERRSFFVNSMSEIANDENTREIRNGQVAIHLDSAVAIRLVLRSLAKFPAERGGRDAAG